jgi:hypothetical protein
MSAFVADVPGAEEQPGGEPARGGRGPQPAHGGHHQEQRQADRDPDPDPDLPVAGRLVALLVADQAHSQGDEAQGREHHADQLAAVQPLPEEAHGDHGQERDAAGRDRQHQGEVRQRQRREVEEPADQAEPDADDPAAGADEPPQGRLWRTWMAGSPAAERCCRR